MLNCSNTVFRLLSFVPQENWHSKFRLSHLNMDETLKSEVCAFMVVRQRDLKFANLKEVTQFMFYAHFTRNLCMKTVSQNLNECPAAEKKTHQMN